MKIENNRQALRAMTIAFKIANKSVTRSFERGRELRATAKRIFAAVEAWDAQHTKPEKVQTVPPLGNRKKKATKAGFTPV